MQKRFIAIFLCTLTGFASAASLSPAACPAVGNNCRLGPFGYDVCTATSDVNFTIEMSNYAEIIDRALTGQPINTDGSGSVTAPIAVPTCIAAASNVGWGPLDQPDECMKVEFSTTDAVVSSAEYPNIEGGFGFALTNSSDSSYTLAASDSDTSTPGGESNGGYCPCGNFPATETACTGRAWPSLKLPFNTQQSVLYNSTLSTASLGYCIAGEHQESGVGGFWFNIYAPIGTIPSTGDYKGSFSVNAQAMSAPGELCS